MQKQIGWFWMIGFFGLVATADAQTASPPAANPQFDGTYGFVSSTRVNETYAVTGSNRIGQCRKMLKVGPLTIVNAQARFSSGASGQNLYEGRANSQGELAMRSAEPTPHGGWAGVGSERMVFGRIQGGGTVHARQKFAL
jgi:hypothetical protein